MSLSLEQVRHVAQLARIEISDAEAETTRGHLNGIFALIEEMQAVDTRGIEPMAHAQDLAQRLRPDVVTETNRRDAYVGFLTSRPFGVGIDDRLASIASDRRADSARCAGIANRLHAGLQEDRSQAAAVR